ncbi:MAG: phosphatase PAP2 family protein [Tunicatimonas sp.]
MTTKNTPWRRNPTLLYAFLFLLLSTHSGAYAQEGTYRLGAAREIPLLATGSAGVTASILLRHKREPLSLEDVGKLNVSDVLAIDRRATRNYSERAVITSDALVGASFAAPLVLLAFKETRSDAGTLGLILLESVMLNEALTGLTKALVRRPRPNTYNANAPGAVRTANDNTFSFFSGHTSHSAAVLFFTAKTLTDYIDHPGVRAVAWTTAAVLPAATGFFRYKAGKHFPSDVIVGYVVGATVGVLTPHLHKIKLTNGGSTLGDANGGEMLMVQEIFSVALVF